MDIIILGAGQVGSTLTEELSKDQNNDVTVVDTDLQALQALQDRLDIRTVQGFESFPRTLDKAGAGDADMVIAVAESDETNIVACQVAATLFNTPRKIARVRSAEYLRENKLFGEGGLPIDMLISPEQLVTDYIRRLNHYPGALQVADFAEGKVRLVVVKAYYGGPLVGEELRTLREHIPGVDTRVAAIYRRGKPILPQGDTTIEVDDEIFFIAATPDISTVIGELRHRDRAIKRVVIGGGGNIGLRLARALEGKYQVKLIEQNRERARYLSERLKHGIVLVGDGANESLLQEENIESADVFCAVTNDDEANILSCMLAKRLGANKTLSLINRLAYVDLVQGEMIDIAISPQQATVSVLLSQVRRGHVVRGHRLRRGTAEAIEVVVQNEPKGSKVAGRRLDELKLPQGTAIGAVRDDEVIIAHGHVVLKAGDHVVIFIVDNRRTADVVRLFQLDATS